MVSKCIKGSQRFMTCVSVINEGSQGAETVLSGTRSCNVIITFLGILNSLPPALLKLFDLESLIPLTVGRAGIVGDLSEN